MYVVRLQYFDNGGHFLGDGQMLSPGKSPNALREFVKAQDTRELCGFRPAFIYARPETGDPVLVNLGG